MASIAFQNIISEHFDIQDDYTRKTLLAIDEADSNKVLDSLTSKLYQAITEKAYEIDFSYVEDTKGDITTLANYEKLLECINIIKSILIEYHQDTKHPDTILTAIANIRDRRDTFTKAFAMKMDLPILLYNTIVLSIVSSTSLIISTSMEFIRDAGDQDYNIKFDKVAYAKSSQSLLFSNLEKFNKSCSSGELDKTLDHVFSSGTRQLLGINTMTVVSIVGITVLVTSIIPILRELTFFFYHSKQSISDYFEIQADLLQMNSQYLSNNTTYGKTDKERKEIAKRQEKIAKNFRKIGNAMAVDNKKAEAATKKDIASSKKKYKVNDVVTSKLDSAPDLQSNSSSSSLF